MTIIREKDKTCPLCGSAKVERKLKTLDYSISQEPFDLLQCKQCSFIFTGNVPLENETGPYYQSETYISHSNSKEGLVNRLYHLGRTWMLKRKSKMISGLIKLPGKLLDIGTGTGYFLHFMQKEGYEVSGVEKSQHAREFAKEQFKLEVESPEVFLKGTTKECYDIITLWHVLEHLYNPDNYLARIRSVLKKPGFLVVALPNCNSYDADFYKEYWAGYDVPRHLWHFTPDTVLQLAEKNGFHLTGMKRLPLDSFYISLLSEKYKKGKTAWVSGILKGKISFLKSLQDVKRSSSVIYILQKDNLSLQNQELLNESLKNSEK